MDLTEWQSQLPILKTILERGHDFKVTDLPLLTDIEDGDGAKAVCLVLHPSSDIESQKWPSDLKEAMYKARDILRGNPSFHWTPQDSEILQPFIGWRNYSKTCIAVDGNHIFFAQIAALKSMKARDFLDPVKFLNEFEKYVPVALKTWVSAQRENQQQAFNECLRKCGWDVVSADVEKSNDTFRGNMDHEVSAVLLDGLASGCETFILFAGDGDYLKHVKALKKAGKRVIIVSNPSSTSRALLDEANLAISVDRLMIRSSKDRPLHNEAWWHNEKIRCCIDLEKHPLLSEEEKEVMRPLWQEWKSTQKPAKRVTTSV